MPTLQSFSKPLLLPHYPDSAGVYVLIDESNNVLYVGSSGRLCQRVSHLTAFQKDSSNAAGYSHTKAGLLRKYQKQNHKVSIRIFKCKNYRVVEKELIEKLKPIWNHKPKRKRR
jgi:excinuclease UvrABC nuclease subunit